jgi:hypothetical protein
MIKIIQRLFVLLLLLSINACVVAAPVAVLTASAINDLPIEFNEIKQDEVLKIEFKDREFIESQITDTVEIQLMVSQIIQSPMVDPVQGNFYRTVELVLTDERVVRIGVNDSYLKNGNAYYQMGEELNEKIKKHF